MMPPDPTGPPRQIEALPRELSTVEDEVVGRSNDFGFELLGEVHARERNAPNVVLSPFSASMVLGMALNGAAGNTFDQMRRVLGLEGIDPEAINRSYRALAELLLTLDPSVELGIANSAWIQTGLPLLPGFRQALTSWFDAEARPLDFDAPGAEDVINGWACEATRERICKVLDRIGSPMVLFLLNAVYFQGEWTDRFDPADTRPAPFRLDDGRIVQVDRMVGRPRIGTAWDDGVRIGELPYGGQAWVMTIVLPADGETLAELVARLDRETWARWTGSVGAYREAAVELPRFSLDYETRLDEPLMAMGMTDAFSAPLADFSRLSPSSTFIDFVQQNTFVKVDEEGTESAAVTTVGIGLTSAPPSFVVDRPFLLAIRERLTGTVLFLGAIGDPRAGAAGAGP